MFVKIIAFSLVSAYAGDNTANMISRWQTLWFGIEEQLFIER